MIWLWPPSHPKQEGQLERPAREWWAPPERSGEWWLDPLQFSGAPVKPRFREGVPGEVECELGLGMWRHLGVMQRKEGGSRHEARGVFSFPADLLFPLTLELPSKTGPEDRDRRSVQISKNWMVLVMLSQAGHTRKIIKNLKKFSSSMKIASQRAGRKLFFSTTLCLPSPHFLVWKLV